MNYVTVDRDARDGRPAAERKYSPTNHGEKGALRFFEFGAAICENAREMPPNVK